MPYERFFWGMQNYDIKITKLGSWSGLWLGFVPAPGGKKLNFLHIIHPGHGTVKSL